jgi:5-methylcytosine-specific restriction endonuclease McrA
MKDNKWIEVWELYEGICVICYGKASCIHELIPRSKNPKGWNTLDNRVTLCQFCHQMIHSKKPNDYVELLIYKRNLLLSMLGKSIPADSPD